MKTLNPPPAKGLPVEICLRLALLAPQVYYYLS